MKKIIIVIVALIVVVFGYYFINNKYDAELINNIQTNTKDSIVPSSENVIVDIKNFTFNPDVVKVEIGTKVTWINNDSVPHTVTSDSDNVLNSPTLSPGESFSFVFSSAGPVNYHCDIHRNMKGLVEVK